jgi:predicted nucleic-acid-binding protein
MIGLDTNVLVRYLVQDDAAQCARVDRLFRDGVDGDRSFYLPVVVLCELVWVLASGYGLDRAAIGDALDRILLTGPFTVERKDLVRQAVAEYVSGRGDFADSIIGFGNREAGCPTTVSFDRGLKKSSTFQLL